MKKIDLHIHTVPTVSDSYFEFSIEALKDYVETRELDAIAITNHDVFDDVQFLEIERYLDCIVFPGIEINLGKGHLLLISDNENIEDFKNKADQVTAKITSAEDSITVEEFSSIYGDLNKYLLIPHYEKRPSVSTATLDYLKDYISTGEVDSPKKFIRLTKSVDDLTPVIFSDIRLMKGIQKFPIKQTYIDCGDITVSSIKHCLKDKSKVAISREDGNSLFQAFSDGQMLSTGLNVILGSRSSGKTHTLKELNSESENVKYIPQFSLVQQDDSLYEREFTSDVARKRSLFVDQYLTPFKGVLDEVINIDLERNSKSVESYLSTLLKSAEEAEKKDAFSKCALFNEVLFQKSDEKLLKELIKSVGMLVENIEYRHIIDSHIKVETLKSLACSLIEELWEHLKVNKAKELTNSIINEVQVDLKMRTSATSVEDVDLYEIMIEYEKVRKFKEIVFELHKERVIHEESFQGFKVICKQKAYEGAGQIKNESGTNTAFSDAYKKYNEPYKYLRSLKENPRLSYADFYRYFTNIRYEILNRDGYPVSGGERSEFRLLQEIKDSQNYDYLLIDEPESSFDNMFLKGEVNQMLKEISRSMPVVIVTHNSTVGASINPDYILYTSKELVGDEVLYRRFSGRPSDVELHSIYGDKVKSFEVMMDSLEAGEVAYNERKSGYEIIKN